MVRELFSPLAYFSSIKIRNLILIIFFSLSLTVLIKQENPKKRKQDPTELNLTMYMLKNSQIKKYNNIKHT